MGDFSQLSPIFTRAAGHFKIERIYINHLSLVHYLPTNWTAQVKTEASHRPTGPYAELGIFLPVRVCERVLATFPAAGRAQRHYSVGHPPSLLRRGPRQPPRLKRHGGAGRRFHWGTSSCGVWSGDGRRELQRLQGGAVKVQVPLVSHALVSTPTRLLCLLCGDTCCLLCLLAWCFSRRVAGVLEYLSWISWC
jgi:hypothetical protein